ncbi:MAG TPA: hypothetical protein VGT41_04710 [Candidatus Babeliales bacterium]|nr:hypothetical protein [Candidatus Babeliales bacterium]
MHGSLKKTALLIVLFSGAVGQTGYVVANKPKPAGIVSKVGNAVKKTVATVVGLPLFLAAPINGVFKVMTSDKEMFAKLYTAAKDSLDKMNFDESSRLPVLHFLNREGIRKQWAANVTLAFCATVPASIMGAVILYQTWLQKSINKIPSRKRKEDVQETALSQLMRLVQQVESDKIATQDLKTIVQDAKQLLESIAHSAERAEFAAQQVEALVKQLESSDVVQAKGNYHSMKAYKDARKRQAEAEAAAVAVGGLSLLIAIALIGISR